MKPLKFSEVMAETAKRTGHPVEVVEALLRVYFKDLRGALTGLSYPTIQVLNLGTFSLKPRALEKKRVRKKELLEKLGGEPERTQQVRKELAAEIEEIEKALHLINSERKRKCLFRKANNNGYEQRN